MFDYLNPRDGAVVDGMEAQEVVYAANQPELRVVMATQFTPTLHSVPCPDETNPDAVYLVDDAGNVWCWLRYVEFAHLFLMENAKGKPMPLIPAGKWQLPVRC